MSYVRALTICVLLVYFVSAAGCHCFDLNVLDAESVVQFQGIPVSVNEFIFELAEFLIPNFFSFHH